MYAYAQNALSIRMFFFLWIRATFREAADNISWFHSENVWRENKKRKKKIAISGY